ncbi:hypothetical protein BUL40_09125 [Croceivirga radicis]|uniref:Uncharacterized protein n=1 Tax=Croceivirga radicis TaxID=1929488 RepID=A0A1V6LRK1_9FLAO|nr:hypothetical protein [Croceivirga radicis]OQD42677.1 hypothetical protein BUL40_09125 [Croceivirga radicis]
MKTILQIALWILCGVFAYLIYQSVMAPIEFNKVREERYAAVIAKLKDIRDSQEAYKKVNGKYAKDFNSLIQFIDTANFTITQQRDSSFMRYDKRFQIDMQVDTVVVDTLGFVKVKDTLFGKDNRYTSMMNVPYAQGDVKFDMKTDIIEKSGFKAPVFEVSVKKDVILYDQPDDLRAKENSHNSVEEVNGNTIKVGSLTEVSTNGNWPPIYDRKLEN